MGRQAVMLFALFFCYAGLVSATASLPPNKPCAAKNVHKKCGKNEHPVKNMTSCQKTCGNRLLTYPEGPCASYSGCVCNNGFVRPHDNGTGTCIPIGKCPPIPKKCGYNEKPTSCAQVCPPESCDISYTDYMCEPKQPCKPGCNCKPDHLRNASHICIPNNECPPPPGTPVEPIEPTSGCNGDGNATYTSCTSRCPRSCGSRSDIACPAVCGPPGCQCKPRYVLAPDGKCILPEDCPADKCSDDRCRPTCEVPNPPHCPPPGPYDPKDPCQCPPEYILSEKGGNCIHIATCPDNNTCNGKKNAVIRSCAMQCPATCDKPNSRVKDCKKECKLGCECKPGYILSKKNGECIRPEKCPYGYPCKRPNEEFTSCTVSCTPVYCPTDDVDRVVVCDIPQPCDAGCVCKHNHRRLSVCNDTCIPAEYCPEITCTRINEQYFGCRPYCPIEQCSEVGKPCSPPFVRQCDPRCTCKNDFYRNSKGVCVKKSECRPDNHIKCGQYEEETDQKRDCPPETCESRGRVYKCPAEEPKIGCKCIDGHYRDKNNKCVPEDQCPKTDESGEPQTPGCSTDLGSSYSSESSSSTSSSSSYSQVSSSSSSDYSSSQESRRCGSSCPLKCKSTCANPNPSGCDPNPDCNCKSGYVWTNDGRKCIPISQCPTDKPCNGDCNAHIMERPPPCPPTCDDRDGLPGCKKKGLAVGCACNTGYLFNEDGICVKPEKCPGSSCPLKCKSTCSNPNPIGCDPNPDCRCQSGYVWTDDGRKCIPISQCPTDKGCNGDPHAHIMESPPACPPTCDAPNGIPLCKRMQLAVGCACNKGYLFNEDGICVKPEKCPGSSCPLKCKSTCSNPNPIGCDPNPDCRCESGYVWTDEGRKCIPISQCPTNKGCNGDPHAHIMEYPPACPPTCDAPNGTLCKRLQLLVGCACNKGYLYNEDGICVKPEKCPGYPCPLRCKPTCANPNPRDCDPNQDCGCEAGYVWTNDGRKCIPISQCPTDKPCNGDSNAHIMERPPACPSTCDVPDGMPGCKKAQLPVGCACNIGYLFNNDGICVKPDNCPDGNPCGVNGTFAPCKMDCPSYFCPKDDRRGQVVCDPAPNCPPGCVCKYKYRWRSEEDRTCILAQECPERKCTRPSERWNSCPSPCLDESCSSYNNPPTTCETFQEPECYPQCTCKDGYARNDEDICIPGKCCPK